MKNVRIFLAVLLILATVAFVGCSSNTRNGLDVNDNNTTNGGIVDDMERDADRVIDDMEETGPK